MPAIIEVITEKDIQDLADGVLDAGSRDAVADFVERDAEAGAFYRAALKRKLRKSEPSERLIMRTEEARLAEAKGTARRVLIFSVALVVSAFVIAGVVQATV